MSKSELYPASRGIAHIENYSYKNFKVFLRVPWGGRICRYLN